MNTSIFSAAMIVDSNGLFGTLDAERGINLRANRGMQALMKIYKAVFRIPENLNHSIYTPSSLDQPTSCPLIIRHTDHLARLG